MRHNPSRTTQRDQLAAIGFGLLAVAGTGLCLAALLYGRAPLNAGLQLGDWIKWVRIEGTASGLAVIFAILGLIGLIGAAQRLLPVRKPAPQTVQSVSRPAAPVTAVTAEIIPFRQEPPAPQPLPAPKPESEPEADPIAEALLADTPDTVAHTVPKTPAPDINAVIHSAMRFIEAPDPAPQGVTSIAEVHSLRALTEHSDAPPPPPPAVVESPPPATVGQNAQALIAAATRAALTQWPEATRPIAEAELGTRLSQLYYDPSPESRAAFEAIGAGELAEGAARLREQAEPLGASVPARAADLWRIYGALHMGRDDAQAMHAYEQVSALDAADGDIHLYLVRRYEMAGRTEALLPVIGRALAVTEDTATRTELLTRQAELAQGAEDWGLTASALEGLSLIRAREAAEDPDNLQKRSAHAILLARLAQVRERMGDLPAAGPLYAHAHEVFAELSAKVPDHAGLRAMAENALRDAQRLRA